MSQTEIPTEHDAVQWFSDHFDSAAQQIIDFIAGDGLVIEGKTVADVGSGDGIIDLGFLLKARPGRVIGFDLRPTDIDALRRSAAAAEVGSSLPDPERLTFLQSEPDRLPAPNDMFDIVYTWSVFEHVSDPTRMLQEVHRILKPDGVFFLQLWPFYSSRHGGHAWMAVSEPFAHLSRSPFELEQRLRGRQGTDPTRTADDEFQSLNRLTLDGLQRALLLAHLRIAKVELLSETVHLPPEIAHHPLTDLAISGIKLLATPF
jgi:SAM-dependent methyltransferase